jgi:hypothetical protein
MVLVHDNDLAELHGIYDGTVSRSLYCTPIILLTYFPSSQPIELLQPDAMLSHLRSAQLKIHEVPVGLGKRPPSTITTSLFLTAERATRKICRLLTMAGVLIQKLFWIATLSNLFEELREFYVLRSLRLHLD